MPVTRANVSYDITYEKGLSTYVLRDEDAEAPKSYRNLPRVRELLRDGLVSSHSSKLILPGSLVTNFARM